METVKLQNKTSREYFEKYNDLVDVIGASRLTGLVPLVGYNTLQEAYQNDKHLNNIPLQLWDMQDASVRHIIKATPRQAFLKTYHKHGNYSKKYHQTIIWSLSESVSLLKHVAIYHIIGAEPIFE